MMENIIKQKIAFGSAAFVNKENFKHLKHLNKWLKKEKQFLNADNLNAKLSEEGFEFEIKDLRKRYNFYQAWRKQMILHLSVIVICIVSLLFLSLYIHQNFKIFKEVLSPPKEIIEYEIATENQYPFPGFAFKQSVDDYLYFLYDGDQYFKENDFHNAAFQYNMASKLYPGEVQPKVRLALLYAVECEEKKKNCWRKENLMKELLTWYSDHPDVYFLKHL